MERLGRLRIGTAQGNRWLATLLLMAAVLLVASAPASAEPSVKRAVLGTIVTAGTLEIATEPNVWKPAQSGSPVIEGTALRTQGVKRGLVALGKHGVIGFSGESHVRIGKAAPEGLPISLEGENELSFRMPATTAIYFLTDSAIVKGPMALSASSADALIQGTIKQRGKKTIVSVAEGEVSVRNRDGEQFLAVASGNEVVIAARNEPPRPVGLAQGEGQSTTRRRVVSAGFLGTKKGLLIVGGTAAAVAGGIAVAAASGGSSDSSSGSGGGGSSASPFMP